MRKNIEIELIRDRDELTCFQYLLFLERSSGRTESNKRTDESVYQ